MRILIMRHGEAQPQAVTDAQRPLTSTGYQQAAAVGKWLRSQGYQINKALVSPYLRAQQTFSALAAELGSVGAAEVFDGLTPNSDELEVIHYLHQLLSTDSPDTLLIVSHLPLVGYLAATLCSSSEVLSFKTSTMVSIAYEYDRRQGRFEWIHHYSTIP